MPLEPTTPDERVRDHALRTLEYSVLCARFIQNRHDGTLSQGQYHQGLQYFLDYTREFQATYRDHLDVPIDVLRFQKEEQILLALLRGCQEQTTFMNPWGYPFSRRVRDYTAATNVHRLLTVRLRRLLTAIRPLAGDGSGYSRWMEKADYMLGPFFTYLAWVFFIPRLFVNAYLLFKHWIPGPWMSEAEAKLSAWARLQAQWDRRGFELANDLPWLVGGVLNCFVFIGALSPIAAYLTVALQAYDVLASGLQAWLEFSRLRALSTKYANDPDVPKHLAIRRRHEMMRLIPSIVANALIMTAGCLLIPGLVAASWVPLAAAILAVVTTLVRFLVGKWVDSQKPRDQLSCLLTQGFFCKPPGETLETSCQTPVSYPDSIPSIQHTSSIN